MDNYNDSDVLSLKSKDRLKSFDCLKLFAIFLVIWGHSIQYFLSSMYYDEPVYRIIYSFHMPLFMMISGYFSLSSLSLSPLVFFKKKFIQLLLPTFSWIIVLGLIGLIKIPFKTCFFTENYEIIALCLKNIIREVIIGFYGTYPFWFLKTCFVCFLLAYCGSHLRLNKYVWMIITIILSQFISHFALFDIMYPCFVIGMELRDNQRFFKQICKNFYWYMGVFILMLCFWNRSFWTYDGSYRDMLISILHVNNSFIINNAFGLYRLTIGIIGSLAIIGLFCFLIPQENNNKMVLICGNWGQYTLGIYIMQSIILETYMAKYICLDNMNFFLFNFIVAPLMSLLVLVLCVYIIKLMSKSPVFGFIFFGNSKDRN